MRRSTPASTPGDRLVVQAPVRIGRRTKDLVKQLLPGEIAVIDHADLDRVAAEGLVEAAAVAVLDAAPSMTGATRTTGRCWSLHPEPSSSTTWAPASLDVLRDGDVVTVVDNEVARRRTAGDRGAAAVERARSAHRTARHAMGAELERFATNTLEYLRREHHLATDVPDLPSVKVSFRDRHALVVVRGVDYREDLAAPQLIRLPPRGQAGDDRCRRWGRRPPRGGSQAAHHHRRLRLGVRAAIRSGAELVVHAYLDGKSPGAERLQALGRPTSSSRPPGTSEDIAMLLAHESA